MFIGTCWREATPAVAVALVKSRRRRRLSFLCSRWLPLHLSRQTRSAGTRLPAKVDTCIQVYEYMYESVAGEREREDQGVPLLCSTAASRLRRGKHMAPSARRPDPLTGAPSRERSSPSERARGGGRDVQGKSKRASEEGGAAAATAAAAGGDDREPVLVDRRKGSCCLFSPPKRYILRVCVCVCLPASSLWQQHVYAVTERRGEATHAQVHAYTQHHDWSSE